MPGHWKRSARLYISGMILKQSRMSVGAGDDPRIVAVAGAQHLPEVALLGLGGNPGGRTGALHVDHHDRSLHHGRHAEAFGHQGEAAAGGGAHGAHAGVRGADRHVDHADLVFHLPDHDAGLARVGAAIQCSTPVEGLIG